MHLVLRLRGGGNEPSFIKATNLTTGEKETIRYYEGMTITELKNKILQGSNGNVILFLSGK